MTEKANISDTLATLRKELESSAPTAKKKTTTDLPRPALCDCPAFARRVHGLVLRGLVPGNETDPELSALVHAFQVELEELPEGCSVEHSDLFAQTMQFHDRAYAQLADAIVQSWSTVAAAMQQREERRVQHDAETDTEAEEWRAWCREMFPRQSSTVPAVQPPPPASFAESEYMQSERAVREQQALLATKVTDIAEALQQPPPGPSPDTMAALKQEEQALRSAVNRAVQYKAVVRARLLTAAPLAVFQDPPEAAKVEDEEAQVAEAIGRVIEEESVKRKLSEYFDTREYLSYLIESHVAAMGAFLTALFTHLRRICDDIDQEETPEECAGCLYRKEVARRSALIARLQTGGHAMFGPD